MGDGGKNPLNTIMKGYARYYATNTVKLGGVRIPHLYPGDSLNLQTAQNADNGFLNWKRRCYVTLLPDWVCRMSSFPGIIHRSVIPVRGIRQ